MCHHFDVLAVEKQIVCKTCTNVHELSWYLLTPCLSTPSTSSAMMTPETLKRTSMTLNQQMKEISKWSAPLIGCISPSIGAVTNNHL